MPACCLAYTHGPNSARDEQAGWGGADVRARQRRERRATAVWLVLVAILAGPLGAPCARRTARSGRSQGQGSASQPTSFCCPSCAAGSEGILTMRRRARSLSGPEREDRREALLHSLHTSAVIASTGDHSHPRAVPLPSLSPAALSPASCVERADGNLFPSLPAPEQAVPSSTLALELHYCHMRVPP